VGNIAAAGCCCADVAAVLLLLLLLLLLVASVSGCIYMQIAKIVFNLPPPSALAIDGAFLEPTCS